MVQNNECNGASRARTSCPDDSVMVSMRAAVHEDGFSDNLGGQRMEREEIAVTSQQENSCLRESQPRNAAWRSLSATRHGEAVTTAKLQRLSSTISFCARRT